MKLPAMSHNLLSERGFSSFDFQTQLQFEAGSSLLRSRSDAFIRYESCEKKHGNHSSRDFSSEDVVDPWNVPAIDFTLHRYRPTNSKLKSKKGELKVGKQTMRTGQFVWKPIPKVLEKPNDKGTPFVTTFRIHSAGAAKRLVARDGMCGADPYKPLGPHAFRGDDFRLEAVDKLKGKPRFITSSPSDPGNLVLKRKSLSVHNDSSVQKRLQSKTDNKGGTYALKPFVTSVKQRPKWDACLVLPKEAYQRGTSEDHIRMNRIMKHLSWCSETDKVPIADRPDVKDYKTLDWLHVTRHPKEETTILR